MQFLKDTLGISLSLYSYTSTLLALKGRRKLLEKSSVRAAAFIAHVIADEKPNDKG